MRQVLAGDRAAAGSDNDSRGWHRPPPLRALIVDNEALACRRTEQSGEGVNN